MTLSLNPDFLDYNHNVSRESWNQKGPDVSISRNITLDDMKITTTTFNMKFSTNNYVNRRQYLFRKLSKTQTNC